MLNKFYNGIIQSPVAGCEAHEEVNDLAFPDAWARRVRAFGQKARGQPGIWAYLSYI